MPNNSESKTQGTSSQRATTDTTTTGQPIRKGKRFSINRASPDDPIFKRGFVIGGRYSSTSSKGSPRKK